MFSIALVIQVIIYLLIFIIDDYAGVLLSLILGCICLAIWLLSLLVEYISPSRIKHTYYQFMLSAWLSPLIAFALFIVTQGGLSWLN